MVNKTPSVTHACHLPQEGGKTGRRGAVPYDVAIDKPCCGRREDMESSPTIVTV